MRRYLTAIIAVLALAGCEPPKDASRFISAKLAPDGNTGVFVFKREVYYPGTMGLLGPGRKMRYVVNQSIIGTYHIASGQTRVLYRRDNENNYIHENFDFHIRDIQGSRALVSDGRQKYYWLDWVSGGLTPLALKEELAERGRDLGVIYLVHENGTLIFVNKALSDTLKPSPTEEIWLRRPSGEYERVSEVRSGGYYGFKDNAVHFYLAAQRAYLIYDLDRRSSRKGNPRDIPSRTYDREVDILVDDHGSPQPKLGKKVDGKWTYQELQINTKEL